MWMDIAQDQDGQEEPRSDEEDTVYDRTNPFHRKNGNPFESEDASVEARGMLDEQETRCGLFSWRPHFLQKLANRTMFSVVFTIVSIFQASFWTYYTANISTYEKRFHMDSTSSGALLVTNELAQILVTSIFSYFGLRRHRAKIMTLGVALTSLSCFLMASPHYFLGRGEMTSVLVKGSISPVVNETSLEFAPKTLPLMAAKMDEMNLTTFEARLTTLYSTEDSIGNVTAAVAKNISALQDATTVSDDDHSTGEITPSSSPQTSSQRLIPSTEAISTDHAETTVETPTSPDNSGESQDIPYLNDEMRTVWPMCNRHTEEINSEQKRKSECSTKVFERHLTFSLLFFANFIGGVGSVLYLLCGGPFSEETTVFPNELPRIFGITIAVRLIGAFFGYLFAWSCLTEYISPTTDVIQIDSRWLGAYWLGWTCLGIFMAVFTLVFALFPRQSPREFLKKRSLTHETGLTMLLLPGISTFFGGSEAKAANLFPSVLTFPNVFQGLIRNKIYVLLTLSSITQIFVSVGYVTFLPKYLETLFRVKVADAAILTGISSIPLQVAGLMLGGAFISRYLPSSREISYWNVIVTALQIVVLVMLAFFGCSTDKIDTSFLHHMKSTDLATTVNPEFNQTTTLASLTIGPDSGEHCSQDCDCKIGPILPICDSYTGTAFYSPCHAGCERVVNQTQFLECSCMEFDNLTLTDGFCESDHCSKGLVTFLIFICVINFLNGTTIVGKMLISYKSLQADQRSAIIGFTFLLMSLFSIIPSPIAFGNLFESTCLIREEMCDSQLRGNCWFYHNNSLRFAYNLCAAALMAIAFVLDAFLWKSCTENDVRLYDGELRQLTTQSQTPGPGGSRPFSNVSLT